MADVTCNAHDLPICDAATPYWRESYDHVIGEYVAASDPVTHEVIATVWDSKGFYAGGDHRCDGTVERMRLPLPTWILENLDG